MAELVEWEEYFENWQDKDLSTFFGTTLPQVAQWLARHASDALIPAVRQLIWIRIESELDDREVKAKLAAYFIQIYDEYTSGNLDNAWSLFVLGLAGNLAPTQQNMFRAVQLHVIVKKDFKNLIEHKASGDALWNEYVLGDGATWYRWFLFDPQWLRSQRADPMPPFVYTDFNERLNTKEIEHILLNLEHSSPGENLRKARFLAWLAEYNDVWLFNPDQRWMKSRIDTVTESYINDGVPFSVVSERHKSSHYVVLGEPKYFESDILSNVLNAWYGCLQLRYASVLQNPEVRVILDAGEVFGEMSEHVRRVLQSGPPVAEGSTLFHAKRLLAKIKSQLTDVTHTVYFVSPIVSGGHHFSLFVMVGQIVGQSMSWEAFHYDSLHASDLNPRMAQRIWETIREAMPEAFPSWSNVKSKENVTGKKPPISQPDATCGTFVAYMTQQILDQIVDDLKSSMPLSFSNRLDNLSSKAFATPIKARELFNRQLVIHDALEAAHLFERTMTKVTGMVGPDDLLSKRFEELSPALPDSVRAWWQSFVSLGLKNAPWERFYTCPDDFTAMGPGAAKNVLRAFFNHWQQLVAYRLPFTLGLDNINFANLYEAYKLKRTPDVEGLEGLLERTVHDKVFQTGKFFPNYWKDLLDALKAKNAILDPASVKEQIIDWYYSVFSKEPLRRAFAKEVLETPELFDQWFYEFIEPYFGINFEDFYERALKFEERLKWPRISNVHERVLTAFARTFSESLHQLLEKDPAKKCTDFFLLHRNEFQRSVADARTPGDAPILFLLQPTDARLVDTLGQILGPSAKEDWEGAVFDFRIHSLRDWTGIEEFLAPLSTKTRKAPLDIGLSKVTDRATGHTWNKESVAAFQDAMGSALRRVSGPFEAFKEINDQADIIDSLQTWLQVNNVVVVHSMNTFAADVFKGKIPDIFEKLFVPVMRFLVKGRYLVDLTYASSLAEWSLWKDVTVFGKGWLPSFNILGLLRDGMQLRNRAATVKFDPSITDEDLLAMSDILSFMEFVVPARDGPLKELGSIARKWIHLVPIQPVGSTGDLQALNNGVNQVEQAAVAIRAAGFVGKDNPNVMQFEANLQQLRARVAASNRGTAPAPITGPANKGKEAELFDLLHEMDLFFVRHSGWPKGTIRFTVDGSDDPSRIYGQLAPAKQRQSALTSLQTRLTTLERLLAAFTIPDRDTFLRAEGAFDAWEAFVKQTHDASARFGFLLYDGDLNTADSIERLTQYGTILGVFKYFYLQEAMTRDLLRHFEQQCDTDSRLVEGILQKCPFFFVSDAEAQESQTVVVAFGDRLEAILHRITEARKYPTGSERLRTNQRLTLANIEGEYRKGQFNALKTVVSYLKSSKWSDRLATFHARPSVQALLDYIQLDALRGTTFDIQGGVVRYYAATARINAAMKADPNAVQTLLAHLNDFSQASEENRLLVEAALFEYLKAPLENVLDRSGKVMTLQALGHENHEAALVFDMYQEIRDVADIFRDIDSLQNAVGTYFNPIYQQAGRDTTTLVDNDDTFLTSIGLGAHGIDDFDVFNQAALNQVLDNIVAANDATAAQGGIQTLSKLHQFRGEAKRVILLQANADRILLDHDFLEHRLKPFVANILDDVQWSDDYFRQKRALLQALLPQPAPPASRPTPPPPKPLPNLYDDGEPNAFRMLTEHYLPVRTADVTRRKYLDSEILPEVVDPIVVVGPIDDTEPIPWEEDRLNIHGRRGRKRKPTGEVVAVSPTGPDLPPRSEDNVDLKHLRRYYLGGADRQSQRQLDISRKERDDMDAFHKARREFHRAQNIYSGLTQHV